MPHRALKWSDVTSQNLVDCARWSIPVELISMPLSGFMAPVTLVGSLIQQTAENLSGVVISQLVNPGHPILYGGSPAIFDVRYETTPMGAIETMMLNCANSEIGKRLGMPTQGYIALSDAKQLDAQAGLETGMGALLAALSGINSISGPGMLDFESCLSLEKLVVDNEICGMTHRLLRRHRAARGFPVASHLPGIAAREVICSLPITRAATCARKSPFRPGHRSRQPRAVGRGWPSDLAGARRAGGRRGSSEHTRPRVCRRKQKRS